MIRRVLVSLKIAVIWFAVMTFFGVAAAELSNLGHGSIGYLLIALLVAAVCAVIHILVWLVRDVRASTRPTGS